MSSNNVLQALLYKNSDDGSSPKLSVLDQLLLPSKKTYIPITGIESTWSVIRTMQIRGAPLIAIVACLGLAVDLVATLEGIQTIEESGDEQSVGRTRIMEAVQKKMAYLKTSRPTAVNLFNAMDELEQVLVEQTKAAEAESLAPSTFRERVVKAVIKHAEYMLRRDIEDNKNIGSHGAKALLDGTTQTATDGLRVVTICNTGSLATAGYGTALGVVRALHSSKDLSAIYCLETRPYNQGSRLTAFEIKEESLPGGTLICDSAVGALMRTKGIDACVVGADRVCANGDVANKIGTYNLALIAKAHKVPFYVASPFTTIDVTLKTGDEIEIEERSAEEMIESSKAPDGMNCWNPAFDVTPATLITGIVTEKGVIGEAERGQDGNLDVVGFVEKHTNESKKSKIDDSCA